MHDVGVLYLHEVVLPCFPDIAADNPIVIVHYGHFSHRTLPLLSIVAERSLALPSQGYAVICFLQTTHLNTTYEQHMQAF